MQPSLHCDATMVRAIVCFCLSLPLITWGANPAPPIPAWPDQFTAQLTIYVQDFGKDWSSKGVLYYNYTEQTFRADYINWCLPLFGPSPTDKNNYTCSFLATQGNMYFVNHTSHAWQEYQCCLFDKGLAAVPPDWMKNCQYNGTEKIEDTLCDTWWFPGTNNPLKPCYGYWNAQDKNKTPVQFFGLSSVGPTILQYTGFTPGQIPDVPMSLPNSYCNTECKPPLVKSFQNYLGGAKRDYAWPTPWPSC